jgi:transposase
MAYALDSTTIDLCMSLFPWAKFRTTKSAIKMHTLLDIRGSIPAWISITPGSVHDVNILDELIPEPGSFYVMDRGYIDFKRLFKLHESGSYFVTRVKKNTKLRRLYTSEIDKSTGLRCDQTVVFGGFYSTQDYPEKLRRIKFYDIEQKRQFVFITNNFTVPAITIALLYKSRWKVELFFKWIKSHLRIKSFYGTSENAVKTQIWIAISTYVMVAILRKELKIEHSLYTILQILSVSAFERTDINQLLTDFKEEENMSKPCNQLNLFDF